MGFQPRIIVLGAIFALLFPQVVRGRTWHIEPDGSGDAPTIQAGIDSAQAGDEVVLARGIYSRTTQGDNNDLNRSMIELKPGVNLRSEGGPETTVLDAELDARVIWGQNIGSTLIEGLTITRGAVGVAYGGGGIAIIGSSTPTIANCIISECRVGPPHPGGGAFFEPPTAPAITNCKFLNNRVTDGQGGAIFLTNGTLDQCIFRDNDANGDPGGSGGAISCRDSRISSCIFENNNVAGPFGVVGGAIRSSGNTQITGCKFIANGAAVGFDGAALGAAIYTSDGSTFISECIFVKNRVAAREALGAAIYGRRTADIQVERCTIVGNVATDREGATRGYAGVFLEGTGRVSNSIIAFNEGYACYGSGLYACNVLFGNTLGESICGEDGGGNIFADPQFCATDPAASMNFLLQNDSPCTAENSGACGLIGAAAIGCTSVHVEQRTWSQVKSKFRR